MSNKINFNNSGLAKLSWKVYNNGNPVSNVESVKIIVDGKSHDLDPTAESYETTVSKDTEFKVRVERDGLVATSGVLIADRKDNEVPDTPVEPEVKPSCYYGSLVTGIEYSDEFGDALPWGDIKPLYDAFLSSLTDETISILIDSNPINGKIAHPNTLVSTKAITPNKHVYEFINKDSSVAGSHTVVIYPASYGKVGSIKNAIGATESINSNDINGFYETHISLGDVDYLVYIMKEAAFNTTAAEVTFAK